MTKIPWLDSVLHAIITLAVLFLVWQLFTSKIAGASAGEFAAGIAGSVIAYWFSTMQNKQNTPPSS